MCAKVIHANWKVVQEAFCEAYHVNATHPQIMPYLGDTNSQVDIWDNFARVITPGGTPSPLLDWEPTPGRDDAVDDGRAPRPGFARITALRGGRHAGHRAPRPAGNDGGPIAGDEWVDGMSDAEMMDSIDYTVFPNFHPWGAFNRIVYRFRPNGDDHRSAIMECIFLAPYPDERPPAVRRSIGSARTRRSPTPRSWACWARSSTRTCSTWPRSSSGSRRRRKPGITLGNYQESKIRWLHQKLGRVGGAGPRRGRWCGRR